MYRTKFLLLTGTLVAVLVFQRNVYADLTASMDIGVFRYDEKQSYVEMYYEIPTSELTFQTKGDSFEAQVKVQLDITKEGSNWRSDAWRMAKAAADTADISDADAMLDLVYYMMEPGEYQATLTLVDLNNQENTFDSATDFEVTLFDADSVGVSDIELAISVKQIQKDPNNVYYKNGLEVVPHPNGVFGADKPVLYYYAESYHVQPHVAGGVYQVKCQVTDVQGTTVPAVKARIQKKKAAAASAEIGQVFVAGLPSGVYNLKLSLLDGAGAGVAHRSKRFYVYNPDLQTTDAMAQTDIDVAIEQSAFKEMTEEQLDDEFEQAGYVANPDERGFYKKLEGVDTKKRFVYQFWAKRDPIPATVKNEYRDAYLAQIAEANARFKSFGRDGWKTDRGRIFILYGEPSDIEMNHNNPDTYSHEIWLYEAVEGGVEFVFADLQEYGEFMQIHSTKRGEPFNNRWEEVIAKN